MQCIFHHLKVIEIYGAIGCLNELKLLEIVMKNSMVLEKIVIWTTFGMPFDRKERLISFCQTLLRIPRGASSDIAVLLI
ncbi:hypothetical protein Sjap_000751 [Stephania japonica]|uniref:FBD domain-containing protein n=1 Tax=Stephania japonica TaxID=461633 RepID=A0AAP0KIP4_9MAGN